MAKTGSVNLYRTISANVRFITLLLVFVLPVATLANDEQKNDSAKTPFTQTEKVLLAESMIIVNAWLASENPRAYGALSALLFIPLAGVEAGSESDSEKYLAFTGAYSIALYNLLVDEEKTTKSRLFRNNFVAWNILAAVLAATNALNRDPKTDNSWQVLPFESDGYVLSYQKRF